jgi:hypothetical protein
MEALVTERASHGGGPRHGTAGRPQRPGRVGQRAARRDEVVHQHHRPTGHPARRRRRGELAGGGPAALDRAQRRGVRPLRREAQRRHHRGRQAGPAQHPGRDGGQPEHVLAAPAAGHPARGRDRDQHQPGRRPELGHRRGQRPAQHAGQVTAAALLVGEQAGPGHPRVRRGDGQRGQPGRGRFGPVRPRVGQRRPAARAERAAGAGAPGAAAGQGQVGQDGEHAATVPPAWAAAEGRIRDLWTTSGLWTTG